MALAYAGRFVLTLDLRCEGPVIAGRTGETYDLVLPIVIFRWMECISVVWLDVAVDGLKKSVCSLFSAATM